jgi:hypothetical protein
MFEQTKVIAEYGSEVDAQVACVRLLLNGIEAFVTGDVPCPGNTVLVRLSSAPIQLAVAASQVEWARFFLDVAGLEVLEPDWESLAEQAIDGWICTCCDSLIESGDDVCPVCDSHRWFVAGEDE